MGNDNYINSDMHRTPENPEPTNGSGDSSEPLKQNDSFLKKLQANRKLIRTVRTILFIIASILITILSIVFVLYAVPALSEMTSGHKTQITNDKDLDTECCL